MVDLVKNNQLCYYRKQKTINPVYMSQLLLQPPGKRPDVVVVSTDANDAIVGFALATKAPLRNFMAAPLVKRIERLKAAEASAACRAIGLDTSTLYIHVVCAKSGHGRPLLDKLEEHARKHGVRILALHAISVAIADRPPGGGTPYRHYMQSWGFERTINAAKKKNKCSYTNDLIQECKHSKKCRLRFLTKAVG